MASCNILKQTRTHLSPVCTEEQPHGDLPRWPRPRDCARTPAGSRGAWWACRACAPPPPRLVRTLPPRRSPSCEPRAARQRPAPLPRARHVRPRRGRAQSRGADGRLLPPQLCLTVPAFVVWTPALALLGLHLLGTTGGGPAARGSGPSPGDGLTAWPGGWRSGPLGITDVFTVKVKLV